VKKRPKRKLIPALALAALAFAAPAAAGVQITGVDATGYPQVRVTVVAPLNAAQPRLRENGSPVVGFQATNLGRAKSVVLAVDRSQSMAGPKLADATAAARAFVATKAASDRVEVMAFGHQPVTLTKFSNGTTDANAALAGVTPDSHSGTALWDTIVQAATALSHEDQPGHVIVVVTDGADVSSSSSLDDAINAAHQAHAAVYAIGITGRDFTPGPLRELAHGTGGAYLEASSSAQLAALYSRIATALTHTWQLSYLTAERPGAQIQLDASVPGQGSVADTFKLDAPGVAGPPPAQQPSVLPRSVWRSPLAPFVLAGIVAFLTLLAAGFIIASRSGSWLNARLAPHLGTSQRRRKTQTRRSQRSILQRLFAATEQTFANVKQFRALQRLLTRADMPLLAAELLYLCIGVGFLLGLLSAFAGSPALLTLVFMAFGGAAPLLWVQMKAKARMKAFDNQLPDLLITIAATLKAGHSFRHAIQAVVDEGAEPAAKEFRRVLTETRLGRPMDDALAEMSERINSKNFSFVLTSVTIQRQIGGSLAGLFDMVAETVRQRQQFARKIRSLTAMGRMSAYVLVGLPVLLGLVLTAISPSYMQPLWRSTSGHELLAVGITMLTMGSLILKKIVSFKG
jgi:tight adherence protein B